MPSPRRIEKLNTLFQEEISKIMDRDIEAPEGNIVTVTRVSISIDGHYADTFITILGIDPKKTLANIVKNVYAIQQELNRVVRMRPVPKIRFTLDGGEFEREKVERALAKLKREGGM